MEGDESLKKFTSKMIAENILNCDECESFLRPPTRVIEGIGNVCHDCCIDQNDGLPNPKLDAILYELKFPCENKSAGCNQEHFFKDSESHRNNCKFQTRTCPMQEINNGCKWQGIIRDFLPHFITNHTLQVLNSHSNTFVIHFDFKDSKMFKLLRGKKDSLLLKMEKSEDEKTLSYYFSQVKDFSPPSSECVLKHLGKNWNFVETTCKSLDPGLYGARIDLESLKRITDCWDSITIEINTNNVSNVNKSFDDKFLQLFECPICKNLMKPPIYQCKIGHDICKNCKGRVEICPKCRGQFGKARNYTLEELTAGISYNCVYAHLGCNFTHFGNDSPNHEEFCTHKPFSCPLNCDYTGNFPTVFTHVNDFHSDQIIEGNIYKTTTDFYFDNASFHDFCQKFYLTYDENIFRLTYKKNSDYSFWAVESLKRSTSTSLYSYDIGIIDMRKPERKLIRTDLCFTETLSDDDIFKKCIIFPKNILSSYASNGLFTYYCQIHKK